MARILGFKILNFKTLKDVTLGCVGNQQGRPLSPLTVAIGKNGVGKSALFDAFGFLSDALKLGVEGACDVRGRGGFHRIRSKGINEPILFSISFQQDRHSHPITYAISIDTDETDRPYVKNEILVRGLQERRPGGLPLSLLALFNGKGRVHESVSDAGDNHKTVDVELEDNRKLGIATFGSLKQHPQISAFRRFIEGWHLSYFSPNAARGLPPSGPQRHLNDIGDNLGNVVQFMERDHKERLQRTLDRIAEKIPGIRTISTKETDDGRLLLQFYDKAFQSPFYAPQMSDGTMKLFAYLLLLEDPEPPPFLCIEEPENGLYHKLLETLAAEFRAHATGREGRSQIFITTHQPYFVDALSPDEVWVLEKQEDGFSKITRASEIPYIKNMVDEGQPLGALWYSDYLDAR